MLMRLVRVLAVVAALSLSAGQAQRFDFSTASSQGISSNDLSLWKFELASKYPAPESGILDGSVFTYTRSIPIPSSILTTQTLTTISSSHFNLLVYLSANSYVKVYVFNDFFSKDLIESGKVNNARWTYVSVPVGFVGTGKVEIVAYPSGPNGIVSIRYFEIGDDATTNTPIVTTPTIVITVPPETTTETLPETTTETLLEITTVTLPETSPAKITEILPETSPEITTLTLPETSPETSLEITTQTLPETSPEITTVTSPETSPETITERTTEALPETSPETSEITSSTATSRTSETSEQTGSAGTSVQTSEATTSTHESTETSSAVTSTASESEVTYTTQFPETSVVIESSSPVNEDETDVTTIETGTSVQTTDVVTTAATTTPQTRTTAAAATTPKDPVFSAPGPFVADDWSIVIGVAIGVLIMVAIFSTAACCWWVVCFKGRLKSLPQYQPQPAAVVAAIPRLEFVSSSVDSNFKIVRRPSVANSNELLPRNGELKK